jgi:hypothetical protein
MTTELSTQLGLVTDVKLSTALKNHLSDIFTDYAHDVDLSFYDVDGDSARLQHDQHIMDANQHSYTLYLPMRQYMHLAVANIADNNVVGLFNDEHCQSSQLLQSDAVGGILSSHTTGLFTARQPMEVLEGVSQTFNVRRYMANSAATLVLDPKGMSYTDMKVYTTGFANAFIISDSTYVYNRLNTLVKADKVNTGNELLCYTSVNFPSKDTAPAAAPRRADGGASLWQFKVYVTKADGSITETILDISEPLKAGDLRIIKGSIDDEGAIRPYSTVGVSVTLDWNKGGEYDTPL